MTRVTNFSEYTYYGSFTDYEVSVTPENVTITWSGGWINNGNTDVVNNIEQWIGINENGGIDVKYNQQSPSGAHDAKTLIGSESITVARGGVYYTQNVWTQWGYQSYTGWKQSRATASVTIPALAYPSAPTIGSNTRNSDTQNTVSWTNYTTYSPYDNVLIERSTNGGEWVQIASVAGAATSYADTSTQTNCSYEYRVRAKNARGYSQYSSETGTTYNTPAAPTGLAGVFVAGASQVNLTWNDNAFTETGFTIENSASADFSTVTTATAAANATSYTFTGYSVDASGNTYFRIKATRSSLASAYSNTATVRTLTTPAAPTPVSPASGVVLDMPESVTFSIVHNSRDGSALTGVVWAFSTDGTTYTEVSGNTAEITRTLAQMGASRGSTVYWKAKTKGAYTGGSDSGYGDWCSPVAFRIEQSPSVSITQPVAVDGGEIASVPITVAWNYSDNSGTQASYSFSVKSGSKSLYSASGTGSGTSYEIPVAHLLPENNKSYTVELTVSSTSGLTKTATRIFATDYVEPLAPQLTIMQNSDNASVQIVVREGQADYSEATGTTMSVWIPDVPETAALKSVTIEGSAFKWNNILNPQSSSTTLNQANVYFCRKLSGANDEIISHQTIALINQYYDMIVNLTAMYGSGNEPSTVEAVKATPEYISMQAAGKLTDYDTGSVQTTCGAASGSGSSMTWGALNITQSDGDSQSYTYQNVLGGTYLARVGNVFDTATISSNPTITRNIGVRAYQSGDENDSTVLTDGHSATYYVLSTPTTETLTPVALGAIYSPETDITTNAVAQGNATVEYWLEYSPVQAVSYGLFRKTADWEVAIAATMQSGQSVTDYTPPLDQAVEYRAVAYASSGLSSQTLETVLVDSRGRCFFNYGDGHETALPLEMDLTWSSDISHDRKLYEVIGLVNPVERHSKRHVKTINASGTVWWDDDAKLEELQAIPSVVWFREPRGHSLPVVAEVGLAYPQGSPITQASIKLTEVANG